MLDQRDLVVFSATAGSGLVCVICNHTTTVFNDLSLSVCGAACHVFSYFFPCENILKTKNELKG